MAEKKKTEKTDMAVDKSEREIEREIERENEHNTWAAEKAGWAAQKKEQPLENEGSRKGIRELEVVELEWKQVRGIFTTDLMTRGI